MKEFFKRRLFRPIFVLLQKFGINVTPAHYYAEIPDITALRKTVYWRRAYDLSPLQIRELDGQVQLLADWLGPHLSAGRESKVYRKAKAEEGSGGFGKIEAHILHAFILSTRPDRILQVGCGVSTAIIMQALKGVTAGRDQLPSLTCVEPFPSDYLRGLSSRSSITLVEQRAEEWDPDAVLRELSTGDFLFVDSTHSTTPGSDVNRIILEWLPSLDSGVWVHFHDVYIPYDHAPGLLDENLFFTRESVMLQAFLTCNAMFQVELLLSLLHHRRQDELRELLGDLYSPRPMNDGVQEERHGDFPSSAYLRRVDGQSE